MTPTAEQIERGLFHAPPEERYQWIKNLSFTVTAEQCARGLAEKKFPNLFTAWIHRPDLIYTQEQLTRGLSPNTEANARISWISRQDFQPTLEQVQNGLNDDKAAIQLSWIRRVPWDMVSNEMLQDGLKGAWKLEWIKKIPQGQLTLEQIEAGLADPNPSMVLNLMQRKDYKPTHEHIELGLKSPDDYIRAEWIKMIPEGQINLEQISNMLQDSDIIQLALLNRNDISLTANQVAHGLKENNDEFMVNNFAAQGMLLNRFLFYRQKNQEVTLKEIAGERPDTKKPRI